MRAKWYISAPFSLFLCKVTIGTILLEGLDSSRSGFQINPSKFLLASSRSLSSHVGKRVLGFEPCTAEAATSKV